MYCNEIIVKWIISKLFVVQFFQCTLFHFQGVWYEILHALSRISILTNVRSLFFVHKELKLELDVDWFTFSSFDWQACLIAFTSSFIERELFKRVHSQNGTLEGFVNNSLAYFDVRDFKPQMAPDPAHVKPKYSSTQYCRYYRDYLANFVVDGIREY